MVQSQASLLVETQFAANDHVTSAPGWQDPKGQSIRAEERLVRGLCTNYESYREFVTSCSSRAARIRMDFKLLENGALCSCTTLRINVRIDSIVDVFLLTNKHSVFDILILNVIFHFKWQKS